MNSVIDSILRQIAVALNSELTLEEDHAWLVPSATPELLLTLVWDEEGHHDELTFSLALGRIDAEQSTSLAIELLTANLGMAVMNGPKLSYSPSTHQITLLESVICRYGDEVFIGEMATLLVSAGAAIREKLLASGHSLVSFNQETN
ncbi:hypothetical protein VL10_23975 [Leclercia adecarboxylata]|nr:hypothetical protein VL10_23975 [Leclercia adecarboxylata]KMN66739.1 hypothetical protein VK95_04415 [Leclercia sp. LK8]